ncbi:amino acid ABC transporter ATP-binding protein [Paraburkholderia sp.]|uniref:amino acid ABC transporter ATP-binding protein n=1 Tax=Paraburkholderia sp. TaxID=1926495 RepID=UPI0039E6BC4D
MYISQKIRLVNGIEVETEGTSMEAVVRFSSVCKAFGGVPVLDRLSLDIRKGEVVVFIGPSGSGKTTLLRCINGLTPVDAGTIAVGGQLMTQVEHGVERIALSDKEMSARRSKIGFVFQHFNLFPHLTVLDNITLAPRKVKGLSKAATEARAKELLATVGLADKAATLPGYLSGGQKQRVAIARTLAMDPEVVLLDEITSALDPERVSEVLDVVARLAQSGMTIMMVTHEMAFARKVATRVVFMEKGKLVEQGTPKDIFEDSQNLRVRGFLNRTSHG